MTKIETLSCLCGILQILGLIIIVAGKLEALPVLVGISGFAGVVKVFLPMELDRAWYKGLANVAAICGFALIVIACFAV